MADSLVKEVDDALRADRMGALWQQHKHSLIAFIAVLIVGTAANALWQRHVEAKGGETLAALSHNQRLLEQGKATEAAEGFKGIAAGANGELKDLALVWQSRALVAAGEKDNAIAALKTAVADGQSLWSDIACLRLSGLDAAAGETCLHAKNASPLAATRAEWSAASLWAKGDHAGAIAAIEDHLKQPDTSTLSRERLTQWLSSMKAQKN